MTSFPRFPVHAVLAAVCCSPTARSADTVAKPSQPESALVYAAPVYDPGRDADADLAEAKKIAARDGRRILLVVGGNWCPWCRAFADFIEKDLPVAGILAQSYVIQKVNVSDETSNTGFLDPYPAIDSYPHLFILDAAGKLLHSQDTGALEKGRGYAAGSVAELLRKWIP